MPTQTVDLRSMIRQGGANLPPLSSKWRNRISSPAPKHWKVLVAIGVALSMVMLGNLPAAHAASWVNKQTTSGSTPANTTIGTWASVGQANLLTDQTRNFYWSNSGTLTDNTPGGRCAELWVDYSYTGGYHHNPYMFRNCSKTTRGWGVQPEWSRYTPGVSMRISVCNVPNLPQTQPAQATIRRYPGNPQDGTDGNCRAYGFSPPNTQIDVRDNVQFRVNNNSSEQVSPSGVIVQTIG